ncbi:hypothetical protein BURPS406E_H0744 [Burkholderia pseudomallei 406e]|nr:hypothetical protein BURPS406E_H0744 [Burkholderia pseudomallei 406e]EEH26711.1 hypothetical protein BUH_1659 [Burkholderia pseudomallei Pakistan 9]KAA8762523.1 hypothetical protein F5D26_32565 [Burkholderia pseudomallei]KGC39369.1 hypothetical protein DO62_6093 [Burkholderia pseudomallei]KGD24716.1 hypothetical protein DO70_5224 [Burkholderia pseudomallei]
MRCDAMRCAACALRRIEWASRVPSVSNRRSSLASHGLPGVDLHRSSRSRCSIPFGPLARRAAMRRYASLNSSTIG